jgi:hypothetical protein
MSKEVMQNAEEFLFKGISSNDKSLNVFDKQSQNQDGIYRPILKEAKDPKIGYKAVIRFLPNILPDGKMGPTAIEKIVHYINLPDQPDLQEVYDCNKNFTDKCDLCTLYWKLDKSKNAADVEKAKLIIKYSKYYSYVLIIEDEQHPELVGKIMVFSYGYQIKEKINMERNDGVNVFDIAKGKNFKLIIKGKGENPTYEFSSFQEISPIQIFNDKTNTFITVPVNEEGLIVDQKVQQKIMKTLMSRDENVVLENNKAKEWSDETHAKVDRVIDYFNGKEMIAASNKAKKVKQDNTSFEEKPSNNVNSSVDANDFFSMDED